MGLTIPQNGVADHEGSHLLLLAEGQEGRNRLAGGITEARLAGGEKSRPAYDIEDRPAAASTASTPSAGRARPRQTSRSSSWPTSATTARSSDFAISRSTLQMFFGRSPMRSVKRIFVVLLLAVVTTLLPTAPVGAITNGEHDNGRHPYVGLLVFDAIVDGVRQPAWRCSGSLLSPTVVLTAGHCTDGAVGARLWLAENVQTNTEYPRGGATSYEGTPYTNPDFCTACAPGLPRFATRDVGIVVLSEQVPTNVVSEYAELPAPGYVGTLPGKTPVDLVGYGVQERLRGGGPPVWAGLRVRLFADAQLVSGQFVHSAEFIRVTANPSQGKGGTCFGDSGGPVLTNNGDTVLAVNSYVTNLNCAGVTYSQRVDIPEVLAWINSFLD
jgi:hypothetical protein